MSWAHKIRHLRCPLACQSKNREFSLGHDLCVLANCGNVLDRGSAENFIFCQTHLSGKQNLKSLLAMVEGRFGVNVMQEFKQGECIAIRGWDFVNLDFADESISE
jgi:hypothetical protein